MRHDIILPDRQPDENRKPGLTPKYTDRKVYQLHAFFQKVQLVNNEVETRRRRKLRAGDEVSLGDDVFVVAPNTDD